MNGLIDEQKKRKDVMYEETDGDLPQDEIIKKCEIVMAKGGITFIKFNCEHCGSRQTSMEPNILHTGGYYCEECGMLNHPKKYGMVAVFTSIPHDKIMEMLRKFIEKEKEKDLEIGYV